MRKPILIIAAIMTLLVVMSQPGITGALLALLLLGMIPGTTMSIPPFLTVIGSIIIGYLLVRWILSQPLYIGNQEYQEKLARQLARAKIRAMSEANAAANEQRALAAKPAPARRRRPA